jgi:hypothetical protein
VVEQRPFKPKVVGSIPTAPTKNPDDSVALALLAAQKGSKNRVFCSQVVPKWFDSGPGQTEPERIETSGPKRRPIENKS